MSNEDDAARLIEALVSPRCGIVTSLVPQMRGADEPTPPYLWNATLAHFHTQQTPIGVRVTGGKGRTEAEAKLSALGEAIERYGSFQWDTGRVRIGPARPNSIKPTDCVLYSDTQYANGCPFRSWGPEAVTSWIEGVELPSGAPVELPASQVYALGPPPRIEDFFVPSASNGLAAGRTLDDAVLSGLYEVIERDAFMLTWLNKLHAREIALPTFGCEAAGVIRHYQRFGVTLRLLSLHTDQAAFVMMAIAEDPQKGGIFRVIGLGCDCDPVVALDKAVSELCQLRAGMRMRMQVKDYADRLTQYEAVQTLNDHPLFHTIPAHAAEFDFLAGPTPPLNVHDLPKPSQTDTKAMISSLVNSAVSAGARVAFVDITPPDIAQLGPRVVRVVITGFQPIHFGFGQGRFGGRRLFEAPVAWGLRDTPLDETGLNLCPHPLA
ncbi:MAG: YcaO-like family protein [Pseudomonadota bacterium]